MNSPDKGKPRQLRLRRPDICFSCGIALSKGAEAVWDPSARTVTCLACAPGGEVAISNAGNSAQAEGNRQSDRRVEQARRRYGDHAAIVAEKMATDAASATWGKGSDGERRLAVFIEREVGDRVIALHDRLIPGTRGNIDHLFIAPTGVWVVDAKSYKGKVVHRESGPIWRRESELYVRGKNRTPLARGVEHQLTAVLAAVRSDESLAEVDIFAALCFVDSEWGLLDFPFSVGQIWVTYPGALRKALRKSGPLTRETMERVARRLDLSLPPAAPRR